MAWGFASVFGGSEDFEGLGGTSWASSELLPEEEFMGYEYELRES